MPKTLSPAKAIAYTYPVGNGRTAAGSFNADRAQVVDMWYIDGGSKVGARVRLYDNADANNKQLDVYVERDISSLDEATKKSEWESANSPTTWSDTISVQDANNSVIHEQLGTDLAADTVKPMDGNITVTSVADV